MVEEEEETEKEEGDSILQAQWSGIINSTQIQVGSSCFFTLSNTTPNDSNEGPQNRR